MKDTPSLSLKDKGRIYLDHNATTPLLSSIVEQLPDWASRWGNPSSIHWSGRGPKNLIREARKRLADLIGCHPLELVFTSGGSESNNAVIKGVFAQSDSTGRNEYITSTVEHPSVAECFKWIRDRGGIVREIPVARDGRIDLEFYNRVLSERTALVSVMAANNETGTLFPVTEMAQKAHAVGARFHTDAVQTLGKIPVNVSEWGVDFATFASHKMYALKGVGLIFAKKGERLTGLVLGGGQERGRRAGTENVLAITAFGWAAHEHKNSISDHANRMQGLRDRFEQDLLSRVPGISVTGYVNNPSTAAKRLPKTTVVRLPKTTVVRLPNTSSLVIEGVDGESLLMNLDLEGISVSTGAACSSGNPEPSPVLVAMGLSRREAQGSLRVSLGWGTTDDEIAKFTETLEKVIARLRLISGWAPSLSRSQLAQKDTEVRNV